MKPIPKRRDQFHYFLNIQTRRADNDIYGHVNNVTYYSYFDTAANSLLIQHAGFDIRQSPIIGLVVDSACSFFKELTFPDTIEVGVAISKIGQSSLRYELAIFKQHHLSPVHRDTLSMFLLIERHEKVPQFPMRCVRHYIVLSFRF